MNINFFTFATMLIFLSSCSLFMNNRTFIDEMDKDNNELFVPGQDFPIVPGDNGQAHRDMGEIMERTPKDGAVERRYFYQKGLEKELADLLDTLPEEEYRHYLLYQDALPKVSEKIFFLRLKTVSDRDEYLWSRGVKVGDGEKDRQEQLAISGREIFVGMSKQAVTQSWGRPHRVDIAGNPTQENERWTFYSGSKPKYVYFEKGKVRGWILD